MKIYLVRVLKNENPNMQHSFKPGDFIYGADSDFGPTLKSSPDIRSAQIYGSRYEAEAALKLPLYRIALTILEFSSSRGFNDDI